MSFKNKPGCPMCSIVTVASSWTIPRPAITPDGLHQLQLPNSAALGALGPPSSPSRAAFLHQNASSTPSTSPTADAYNLPPVPVTPSASVDKGKAEKDALEVVWQDTNFTAYRERKHAVSDVAHFIIVFNLHVPSIYMLSSSDVPLLVALRTLATRLLSEVAPSDSDSEPNSASTVSKRYCIGFITPPWRDPSIPVSDHVHAHAYIGPPTRASWYRRAFAYSSPLAWYAIDDLIAEIREETSNNRIRSQAGAGEGGVRPIDRIPNAGAREGTANGQETTRLAVAKDDPTLDIGLDEDIETGRSPAVRVTETRIPVLVSGGAKSKSKRPSSHVDANKDTPLSLIRTSPPPNQPDSPQEAYGAGSRQGYLRSETIDSAFE